MIGGGTSPLGPVDSVLRDGDQHRRDSKHHQLHVAIIIPTYRRPEALAELLESIARQDFRGSFRVILVDNDPECTARHIAESYQGLIALSYVVEPKPGVSCARNRGLAQLSDGDDWFAFIDDDEVATESWLRALVEQSMASDADIVAGPVLSVFPLNSPKWLRDGNFYVRDRRASGTSISYAGTGNVLMSRAVLQRLDDPWFDTSYNLTGGEDSDFFNRLKAVGARMVWCDEAEAFETVESNRLTVRAVVLRGLRNGTTYGRLSLEKHARALVFFYGLGLTVRAGSSLGASYLRHRTIEGGAASRTLTGAGIVLSALNVSVQVYARHGQPNLLPMVMGKILRGPRWKR